MVINLVQNSENVKNKIIQIVFKYAEFQKCIYTFLINVLQIIHITVIPGVEYNSKNNFKMCLLNRLRFELQSTVILQNMFFQQFTVMKFLRRLYLQFSIGVIVLNLARRRNIRVKHYNILKCTIQQNNIISIGV